MGKIIVKMNYPRFTREENRACKLTQNQIDAIKPKLLSGQTKAAIAKEYGVSEQAIWYWCMEESERKEMTRRRTLARMAKQEKLDTLEIKRKQEYFKEHRRRKFELHPEIKDYENQFTHFYKKQKRPNYDECRKKEGKRYWTKHIEKLKVKNKKYQLQHLDKFRRYNKKYRELYPEKVKRLQRESYLRNKEYKLEHDRKIYRLKFPVIKRKTKYSSLTIK